MPLISYEDYWYLPIIVQQVFFWKKCMNNIKKIYQHAGKCDDQQNLDILDDAMVSTP